MCGLFGAVGRNINPQVIRTLAILNEERGRNATGFFTNDGSYFKDNEQSTVFLRNKDVTKWIEKSCGSCYAICGHTRNSTRGGNTVKNAHPFVYGEAGYEVILSHNGIVDAPNDYPVDSMYACDLLAKAKPGDYQGALGDLTGWYALTWLDRRNGHIYFLNWKSSLAFTKVGDAYYYSSNHLHLQTALGTSHCGVTSDKGEIWCFNGRKIKQLKQFTGKERVFVHSTVTGDDLDRSLGGRRKNWKYWEKEYHDVTGEVKLFSDGKWYAATVGTYRWSLVSEHTAKQCKIRWPKAEAGFAGWLGYHATFIQRDPRVDVDIHGRPIPETLLLKDKDSDTELEPSEQGIIVSPGVAGIDDLTGQVQVPNAALKADAQKQFEEAELADAAASQKEIEEALASQQQQDREREVARMQADIDAIEGSHLAEMRDEERARLLKAGYSETAIEDRLYELGYYPDQPPRRIGYYV